MSLSPDQIFQFRQNLFHDLRNELGQLKTCQTTIFLIGITGSGVFLGLISVEGLKDYIPALLLIPLIILLPLWIIFYDKARTISRIVGFLRVQEELALDNSPKGLIGWESAMKKYWRVRDKYDHHDCDKIFEDAIKNQQTEDPGRNYINRERIFNSTYWTTIYILFFSFNAICLGMSFYLTKSIDDTLKPILLSWFFLTFILIYYEVMTRRFSHIYYRHIKGVNPPHTKFYTVLRFVFLIVSMTALVTLGIIWLVKPEFFFVLVTIIFLFILSIIFRLILDMDPCDTKEGILNLEPCNEKEQCTNKVWRMKACQFKDLLFSWFLCLLSISFLFFFAFFTNNLYHLTGGIKFTLIYLIFGSLFIGSAGIAFWMLWNLIKGYKGRYSYSSFHLRWEITLKEGGEESSSRSSP